MKKRIGLILCLTLLVAIVVFITSANNASGNPEPLDNTAIKNITAEFNAETVRLIFSKAGLTVDKEKQGSLWKNKEDTLKNVSIIKTYENCMKFKITPVFHDESKAADVIALLGEPEYATDDVLYYGSGNIMFAFNDGELSKIAFVNVNSITNTLSSKDIEIVDVLNLQKAQAELAIKLEEEKVIIDKRNELLNSDEELQKIVKLSPTEIKELLGEPDEKVNVYSYYITEERKVIFDLREDKLSFCRWESLNADEGKFIFIDLQISGNSIYYNVLKEYYPKLIGEE